MDAARPFPYIKYGNPNGLQTILQTLNGHFYGTDKRSIDEQLRWLEPLLLKSNLSSQLEALAKIALANNTGKSCEALLRCPPSRLPSSPFLTAISSHTQRRPQSAVAKSLPETDVGGGPSSLKYGLSTHTVSAQENDGHSRHGNAAISMRTWSDNSLPRPSAFVVITKNSESGILNLHSELRK